MPIVDAQDWIDPLANEEKDKVRSKWLENTRKLYEHNGPLNGIWLAGATFEDLLPVIDCFSKVIVPEQNFYPYRDKKHYFQSLPSEIADKIILKHMSMFKLLSNTKEQFDLVNYDACCHFHKFMEQSLHLLFNGKIKDNGMLFLTVANYSPKVNVHGDEYLRISTGMTDDIRLVKSISDQYGFNLDSLSPAVFPLEYKSNGNSNGKNKDKKKSRREMRSYGWSVRKGYYEGPKL